MQPLSKHVLVIGGSFAGVAFIQHLESLAAHLLEKSQLSIILVDRRDGFHYSIGACRSLTEPGFVENTTLSYGRLFRYTNVVQGTVVDVESHQALLDDGRMLTFDYLLVATGSYYPTPAKSLRTNMDDIVKDYQVMQAQVASAKRILVVGGGPLGVEIASDIATDYPDKHVVLLHRGNVLVKGKFKCGFHKKLLRKVVASGVEVILQDSIPVTQLEREQGFHYRTRTVVTEKNRREIVSDLQIFALGVTKVNSQMIKGLDKEYEDSIIDADSGRISVQPTLQLIPPALAHIFAAGDVANLDQMQAFIAKQHGELAADNIYKLISESSRSLGKVKLDKARTILITVGRKGGQGQVPYALLGNWITWYYKAYDMGIWTFQALAIR